jgi:hypothetical protein
MLFQFLGWNKQHREGSTHEFYKRHIVSFAEYIGETLTVGELKPFHVTNWLDASYPKTRKHDGKTVTGVSDCVGAQWTRTSKIQFHKTIV